MDRLSSTAILPEAFQGARDDVTQQLGVVWQQIKAPVIVPLLRLSVLLCLTMSVMLFVEKVYMAIVIVLVKLFRRRPETRYKWEPMGDDAELGNAAYPVVLVQIPMYNEKEIECRRCASKGVNIKYEIRDNRNGYKAGALKEGMKHSYVKQCDYVAVFDADFQPEPDFLWRTIPFLVHNPRIGLVQGRWKFGNALLLPLADTASSSSPSFLRFVLVLPAHLLCFTPRLGSSQRSPLHHHVWSDFDSRPTDLDSTMGSKLERGRVSVGHRSIRIVNSNECLMTRMQEMSLDYHFTVEQEVGSSTYAFFGFNGTAGVWRIAALNEAGGWKDRTTVEDMDLAVRASLKGWKFIFLGDLKVKSELPSTLKAYRYQQHRWSCGPANFFFFVRKIVAHIVTFIFYCVVIPATVLVPEVEVPKWGLVYIPSTITLLNAVGTPRSLHLLVFWILFENVMSLHRTKATFVGLLEAGRVNEWVVTEKLGDVTKTKVAAKAAARKPRIRIGDRFCHRLLPIYYRGTSASSIDGTNEISTDLPASSVPFLRSRSRQTTSHSERCYSPSHFGIHLLKPNAKTEQPAPTHSLAKSPNTAPTPATSPVSGPTNAPASAVFGPANAVPANDPGPATAQGPAASR
ncbi:hypothetical protein BHM03_00039584 [Ensete ventricosum]|nr:hypothetical protein BHM03_00039584 [Ensete ventricosum]